MLTVPEMTTSQQEDPPKDDLKIIDMEENLQKIASVRPWDVGKQGADSGKWCFRTFVMLLKYFLMCSLHVCT